MFDPCPTCVDPARTQDDHELVLGMDDVGLARLRQTSDPTNQPEIHRIAGRKTGNWKMHSKHRDLAECANIYTKSFQKPKIPKRKPLSREILRTELRRMMIVSVGS